jgi:hypothetical protein
VAFPYLGSRLGNGNHQAFPVQTGVPVYFCDPHSPWQRGSNKNTNGLLRQYFPKGTSLGRCSQDDLDRTAISLNGRPRETLDSETPAERLAELLVATTGSDRQKQSARSGVPGVSRRSKPRSLDRGRY